jgi:hypothetical protein
MLSCCRAPARGYWFFGVGLIRASVVFCKYSTVFADFKNLRQVVLLEAFFPAGHFRVAFCRTVILVVAFCYFPAEALFYFLHVSHPL